MKTNYKYILYLLIILNFTFLINGCSTNTTINNNFSEEEPYNEPFNEGDTSKIKNIVLIIGDGMGLEHIKATEIYEGRKLSFTDWANSKVNTDSVDENGELILTDSAAGGTAIATGTLTINEYIGKNPKLEDLETLMDIAKKTGKSTGIITTDNIYGATPSSFSGHSENRSNSEEIFISQIKTSNVDLLCGHTNSLAISNQVMLGNYGYNFCNNFQIIEETFNFNKNYWQFDLAENNPDIQLNDVSEKALNYLDRNENGFMLMIEQAHIDKYAHANDLDGVIKCVNYLDKTVETVLDWIGNREDTLVIVTADHETGGLFCSINNEFDSSFETKNGSNFTYKFTTNNHTKASIGIFVYGAIPIFKSFSKYNSNDLIKNTNTFEYIKSFLKEKTNQVL